MASSATMLWRECGRALRETAQEMECRLQTGMVRYGEMQEKMGEERNERGLGGRDCPSGRTCREERRLKESDEEHACSEARAEKLW